MYCYPLLYGTKHVRLQWHHFHQSWGGLRAELQILIRPQSLWAPVSLSVWRLVGLDHFYVSLSPKSLHKSTLIKVWKERYTFEFFSQGFCLHLSSHADLVLVPTEFHLIRFVGVMSASVVGFSCIRPPHCPSCSAAASAGRCSDLFILLPGHWLYVAAYTGLQSPCTATRNASRTWGQRCRLLSPELLLIWVPN